MQVQIVLSVLNQEILVTLYLLSKPNQNFYMFYNLKSRVHVTTHKIIERRRGYTAVLLSEYLRPQQLEASYSELQTIQSIITSTQLTLFWLCDGIVQIF